MSKSAPYSDTRERIIAAAVHFFAERGYNGTGVLSIAREVGITTASLYYHIANKQELLYLALNEGLADRLGKLQKIASDQSSTIEERVRKALANHLEMIFDRPDAIRAFLRERRFLTGEYAANLDREAREYEDYFDQLIREGMDSGVFIKSEPSLARLAILGMFNWTIEWYRSDGPIGRETIERQFLDSAMRQLMA